MDASFFAAIVPRSAVPELFAVVVLAVIVGLAIIQVGLSARDHR